MIASGYEEARRTGYKEGWGGVGGSYPFLITGIFVLFFLAAVAIVVVDGAETTMTFALVLAALFTIRSIVVVFIGRKLLVVASIRLARNYLGRQYVKQQQHSQRPWQPKVTAHMCIKKNQMQ